MKYLKLYEKYNDNKLNELIVKYYNEISEDIIEIIDTYKTGSEDEIKNIMDKLSFVIQTGDVKQVMIEKELIAYFIDLDEPTSQTIFYDFTDKKFKILSYQNFMKQNKKAFIK